MAKRTSLRGTQLESALAPRQRAGGIALTASATHAALTRRQFMSHFGAAAAALGMPPLLASCGGSDDDDPAPAPAPRPAETRTLFFNFSHLGNVETTHVLVAGGKRYPLSKVSDKPEVLSAARQGNEFLRSVSDDQITHHLESVTFSTSSVTLGYVMTAADPASGTWQMTSMHFNIPSTAVAHAYAQARVRSTAGPLPLSGKRRAYGLRAATSAQDLLDEHALVDNCSHAEALVGLHPELLSLEPNSAAHVHHNYISVDSNTQFLAQVILPTMGPAVPQGSSNVSDAQPWATLVPLMDDTKTPPVPVKMSDGQLNQYYPDWDPQVDLVAGPAMLSVHPLVKNDESLGIDVTGLDPNSPAPAEQLGGKLWSRHDGATSFARTLGVATATAAPTYMFTQNGVNTGLHLSPPEDTDYTVLGDGRVQVDIDIAYNWFLRWLGLHVQFADANGTPIPSSSLPNDTLGNRMGPYPGALDPGQNVLFVDAIASATTVLGVPVYPGSVSSVIKIPTAAQTLRIYYGGPAIKGAQPPELDGTSVSLVGVVMTMIVNYGLTGIFMATGVNEGIDPVVKKAVSLGGGLLVRELLAFISADVLNGGSGVPTVGTATNIAKTLFTVALTPLLAALVAEVAALLAAAQIIDAIPVAGQIARGIAAATGAAELAQTSIEIAISPETYMYTIVLTHDLSVTILPDANEHAVPAGAAGLHAVLQADLRVRWRGCVAACARCCGRARPDRGIDPDHAFRHPARRPGQRDDRLLRAQVEHAGRSERLVRRQRHHRAGGQHLGPDARHPHHADQGTDPAEHAVPAHAQDDARRAGPACVDHDRSRAALCGAAGRAAARPRRLQRHHGAPGHVAAAAGGLCRLCVEGVQ